MLSLTANGEVPVLWVDGGTVAVMPCSRSIRYRAQGGEALREARQTRLTIGIRPSGEWRYSARHRILGQFCTLDVLRDPVLGICI